MLLSGALPSFLLVEGVETFFSCTLLGSNAGTSATPLAAAFVGKEPEDWNATEMCCVGMDMDLLFDFSCSRRVKSSSVSRLLT